jgi:diaminohydroxyphosphoribosylaminopyrimidine deaminase/5-amino-6-(5-phosphoribosylamino)uracil reductase
VAYEIGDTITKEEALSFALSLAQKGLGHVEPNPCVGCVVINEESEELVSYGYHQKFGEAHAEVNALRGLESGEGLTLIVTLEPCSHFGKTPPCADLVASKNFKKVIYFDKDPNPKVSGRGLEAVKASGAQVEQVPEEFSQENRLLNSKFFYAYENKKTFFHLKWAQSLDGKTSLNGESKWITGDESRAYGHFLRTQSDAVLIGRETLEADDPSLNVRIEGFHKVNKVIVFDPSLKSLSSIKDKNIFKLRPKKSVIYLCDEPIESEDVDFVKLKKKDDGSYGLESLAKDLYSQKNLQSVLVEGGAKTLGAFIEQKEFGRASVFTATKFLGAQGSGPTDALNLNDMSQSLELEAGDILTLGDDVFVDLYKK